MPNTAVKIKIVSKTDKETVSLYKITPKTKTGVEFINIKVSRVENKRFPEMNLYNIYYAKSNDAGNPEGDYKLYKFIEAEDSGVSDRELRQRYPGLNHAEVKEYYEEYSQLLKEKPTEFEKTLNYFKVQVYGRENSPPKVFSSPLERNSALSMIKILTDVKGGTFSPERYESPEVERSIQNLFSSVGDGYEITTSRPKRSLELESIQKNKNIIKENKKLIKLLEAEEEVKYKRGKTLDLDEIPTNQVKPEELPKSTRFGKLFTEDDPSKTKPESKELKIRKSTDLGADHRSSSGNTTNDQVDAMRSELDTRIHHGDSYMAVVWAQNSSGQPCKIHDPDIKLAILVFSDPVPHNHAGSNQYSRGTIDTFVWKEGGQLDELSPAENPYRRSEHVIKLNDKNKNLALASFKKYSVSATIENCIPWIESGRGIPTNPMNSSAHVKFRTPTLEHETGRIKWTDAQTPRDLPSLLKKLSLPKKKGGFGAASKIRNLSSSRTKSQEPVTKDEIKKTLKHYIEPAKGFFNMKKETFDKLPKLSDTKLQFHNNVHQELINNYGEDNVRVKNDYEIFTFKNDSEEHFNGLLLGYIKKFKTEVEDPKEYFVLDDKGFALASNIFTNNVDIGIKRETKLDTTDTEELSTDNFSKADTDIITINDDDEVF